jgi:hypothetical protein
VIFFCFLIGLFDFDIGKRQAEEEVKAVSAKKQKLEEVKQKKEAELKKVKKEESSSEEDSSDESEDEVLFSIHCICFDVFFVIIDHGMLYYCY